MEKTIITTDAPRIGIIAEFNPFHLGHAEHIRRSREIVGSGAVIICAMSGNFVQRGDVAVYSKRARALAAAQSGADLVVELPVATALGSAGYFAEGAVRLLNLIGVDYLAFGSESGSLTELSECAEMSRRAEVNVLIREEIKRGIGYASARQSALERFSGRDMSLLRLPNNILAVEYLNALENTSITPLTIKRERGSDSASEIRELLRRGADVSGRLPISAAKIYAAETRRGNAPMFLTALDASIMTRLRCMSTDEFDALPDADEGLGRAVFNALRFARTTDELFAAAKSKRYTMTRVRRVVLCAFLGIRADDRKKEPAFAAVLAASKRGNDLVKMSKLPLIRGSRDNLVGSC
ncbi:MAG: nucleotidyltransferase family protein [Oscillospiraceae bacterium]|jgi:predicted nucleotidyltransferase|nr:nucleotidyltransferase family protein [Oscillospiraceae bacterium]